MNQTEYENACDDAEIAAWNSGAATPEAPEGEDLIELSMPERSTMNATKTYVIVQNAGMDREEVIRETFWSKTAYEIKNELENEFPESQFDVMKRLPDGTLTTEF